MKTSAVLRDWAHSASGKPAEGIPWIEQGIRELTAERRLRRKSLLLRRVNRFGQLSELFATWEEVVVRPFEEST